MKYVWIVPGDHLNLGRSWDLHKLFLVKDVQKMFKYSSGYRVPQSEFELNEVQSFAALPGSSAPNDPSATSPQKTASRNSEVP